MAFPPKFAVARLGNYLSVLLFVTSVRNTLQRKHRVLPTLSSPPLHSVLLPIVCILQCNNNNCSCEITLRCDASRSGQSSPRRLILSCPSVGRWVARGKKREVRRESPVTQSHPDHPLSVWRFSLRGAYSLVSVSGQCAKDALLLGDAGEVLTRILIVSGRSITYDKFLKIFILTWSFATWTFLLTYPSKKQ